MLLVRVLGDLRVVAVSVRPGGTGMIVARQFIAWNTVNEATRPGGTV
jgi:hypothetical protein